MLFAATTTTAQVTIDVLERGQFGKIEFLRIGSKKIPSPKHFALKPGSWKVIFEWELTYVTVDTLPKEEVVFNFISTSDRMALLTEGVTKVPTLEGLPTRHVRMKSVKRVFWFQRTDGDPVSIDPADGQDKKGLYYDTYYYSPPEDN